MGANDLSLMRVNFKANLRNERIVKSVILKYSPLSV